MYLIMLLNFANILVSKCGWWDYISEIQWLLAFLVWNFTETYTWNFIPIVRKILQIQILLSHLLFDFHSWRYRHSARAVLFEYYFGGMNKKIGNPFCIDKAHKLGCIQLSAVGEMHWYCIGILFLKFKILQREFCLFVFLSHILSSSALWSLNACCAYCKSHFVISAKN